MNTLLVTFLALFCYLILPLIVLLVVKDSKTLKIIITSLLIVYLAILIIGVWARVEITKASVKISFDYSGEWFNKTINWGFKRLRLFDICVNLILLFPLGLGYVILAQKPNGKVIVNTILIGLIVGIIIEAGQYILPVKRSVQLSDVVFNMLSMIIGGIVGLFYKKIANKAHFSPKQN